MRIIFVGLHSKQGKIPLDSSTKTGKLIDRIIALLPSDIPIIKSNILEVEYMPKENEFNDLKMFWYDKYSPNPRDVIVLLGQKTHELFDFQLPNIIKVAHPASKRSHKEMDNYVDYVANLIKELYLKNSSISANS